MSAFNLDLFFWTSECTWFSRSLQNLEVVCRCIHCYNQQGMLPYLLSHSVIGLSSFTKKVKTTVANEDMLPSTVSYVHRFCCRKLTFFPLSAIEANFSLGLKLCKMRLNQWGTLQIWKVCLVYCFDNIETHSSFFSFKLILCSSLVKAQWSLTRCF